MNITLEQARIFDAVARYGSFAKAAAALRKGNSAIVYALRGLEAAVGVALLDRSGYRTTITEFGRRVLEQCQKLLAIEAELSGLCGAVRAGDAPFFHVVFDGLLPIAPILQAVTTLGRVSPATRVALTSEYLGEVEARARREGADVLITVVPLAAPFGPSRPLAPLPSLLVAHADHPLATKAGRLRTRDLESHRLLTVRGSDRRLDLSTAALDGGSTFKLGDFHVKKAALLAGLGYGWMPEYLITRELKAGTLRILRWDETREGGANPGRHVFRPVLHVKHTSVGRTANAFIAALVANVAKAPRGPARKRSVA